MTTTVKKGVLIKNEKPISEKESKAELNNANKAATTQKVIVNRALKYRYPKGCTNTLARKTFRQKVRNALRKMERELDKLRGDDRRTQKEKIAQFMELNLAN